MTEVPSEKVQAKAAEYLLSGRIKVREVCYFGGGPDHGGYIEARFFATPTAGGDAYFVKFNQNGWHCDCPARVQLCAHILACQTITNFTLVETGEPEHKKLTTKPNADIDALLADL